MSQHLKSLIQQIQPFLYHTPFSTLKKQDEKSEIVLSSSKKTRRELKFNAKDSGLDSSSSSINKIIRRTSTQNQLSTKVCKLCAQKVEQKVQIRKRLKKAYINYVNLNLSESQFANIPLIVTKSFRPKNDSLNKIAIKKGSAVNALYMIDNKWVYVKTLSEKCGFIPARCCQPFDVTTKCMHIKNVPKIKIPDLPNEKSQQEPEHTYISVDQNMYEKLTNFKSEEPKCDYGLLAEAESASIPTNQYDCLMNFTPKLAPKTDNYYNNLSIEKSSMCLYKVRKDYRSNFSGGLNVSKGDLVYMVNSSLSADLQAINTQNLVFVRVYRRFSSQQYENLNGIDSNLLQGFIPKANLIRLNESNQNSPIYC